MTIDEANTLGVPCVLNVRTLSAANGDVRSIPVIVLAIGIDALLCHNDKIHDISNNGWIPVQLFESLRS